MIVTIEYKNGWRDFYNFVGHVCVIDSLRKIKVTYNVKIVWWPTKTHALSRVIVPDAQ